MKNIDWIKVVFWFMMLTISYLFIRAIIIVFKAIL